MTERRLPDGFLRYERTVEGCIPGPVRRVIVNRRGFRPRWRSKRTVQAIVLPVRNVTVASLLFISQGSEMGFGLVNSILPVTLCLWGSEDLFSMCTE